MNLEGGGAEGDDGGPERERLLPGVTNEVAGVGEHPEQCVGGRDVDAESIGDLRQCERLARLGREEIENCNGSTGGECETCHRVDSPYRAIFRYCNSEGRMPTRPREERP